jgi:hypothetical protein
MVGEEAVFCSLDGFLHGVLVLLFGMLLCQSSCVMRRVNLKSYVLVLKSLETPGESTESHALLPILLLQEEFPSSPGNSFITLSGRRVHV